jgi:hypothetical protein
LSNPVGVQDAQVGVLASDLFLGNGLQVALELELVHTLVLGLSKDHTTVNLTLASSTTDTGTDNHVSLLGLVPQTVGLVGSGRTVETQNVGALTVFPASNTRQETHGVTLLVTPDLFHVLVATHVDSCGCLDLFQRKQLTKVGRERKEFVRLWFKDFQSDEIAIRSRPLKLTPAIGLRFDTNMLLYIVHAAMVNVQFLRRDAVRGFYPFTEVTQNRDMSGRRSRFELALGCEQPPATHHPPAYSCCPGKPTMMVSR